MTAYPMSWRRLTLSDVAEHKPGRTPARANARYWRQGPEGVAWVSIADMKLHQAIVGTKELISREAFDEVFGSRVVPAGTLLMSFKLTVGRVATLALPACHNEAIVAIYPKPGVNQRFLEYYLAQVDYSKLHDRQIKGDTLNSAKLDAIPVMLPAESEQAAIARTLDAVRHAIALSQAALDKAEELKAAAMSELFMCGLQRSAAKDSEIGPIPESWDIVRLGQIREWLQYGTSVRCTTARSSRPVLRIPNLQAGQVTTADLKFANLSDVQASPYLLEPGDLLFVRTNGVLDRLGACAVYNGEPKGALFASYLIRARLKPRVVPRFVAYFFGSERGSALVAGRATPAADGKYNLNTGIIDSLPIPVPPTVGEQEDIVAALEAIDQKIASIRQKQAALDALFRALLHKLMTGEIRASELDMSALTTREPKQPAGMDGVDVRLGEPYQAHQGHPTKSA
jgi:type I restriction enzyme S subunit